MRISSLRPVICFVSPAATFHLNDVRQFYGQPSFLRTIGSRVIPSLSLLEGWSSVRRDKPSSPSTSADWLKYLLDVPFLTSNLLQAAAEWEP